ncbi:hypothetical protein BJP34_00620 [Moorena producens PAL-8-15-08-1]|uniref:Uncharacterized protein n=1 Tax=Moorena producens PAL-8-15-08-1 TaxID=1458985 RepID=A0A1D8TL23_9CYAN|nr:hypothetical protein BJP34_00620 [Moorena producens PAL-8-15-08-1]
MVEGVISITNYQLLITNYQTEILHHCHCLDAVAHGGNHASCSWGRPRQLLMGETTPVAHGGDHASCSWGRPRQLLMGETPKTALAPQDRTGSPRPHWLPKTALAPQDRTGSPRPHWLPKTAQITLILGWAVPTNALCKLHYLSAALPTLHELITNY